MGTYPCLCMHGLRGGHAKKQPEALSRGTEVRAGQGAEHGASMSSGSTGVL